MKPSPTRKLDNRLQAGRRAATRHAFAGDLAAELKDFIMSQPPPPATEAKRWSTHFEIEGYHDVSAREVGPCCWRIKARPPASLLTDAEAKRSAQRIVRRMGRKLLSPGVGAQVGRTWATFVILLMPLNGVFPPNEELLPEGVRQAGARNHQAIALEERDQPLNRWWGG